jgi:hypothetical protein
MKTSKSLIIFEGPDGAGKSTLAKSLAREIGALYTHLGPFPRVGSGLARLYVEAMLPAVLGYSDVVLDRCWLSEIPYGRAFREGQDRIGDRHRLLERLAWRCRSMVVFCTPSWGVVRGNFEARREHELLERVNQLQYVYAHYATTMSQLTSLPAVRLDPFRYPQGAGLNDLYDCLTHITSRPHPLGMATVGNFMGSILLVGESYGPVQDNEPLYQWPFGSLANSGCSLWLARQLEKAGVGEDSLLWVNADQLDSFTANRQNLHVVALGGAAAKKLRELGRSSFHQVVHPQAWKRFHSAKDYPLIPLLKELAHV